MNIKMPNGRIITIPGRGELKNRSSRCFEEAKKVRDYTVILHPAEEGGYWVDVPALPGCYSQGETEEEALVRIREAIEAHIEVLQEDGQRIPPDQKALIRQVDLAIA